MQHLETRWNKDGFWKPTGVSNWVFIYWPIKYWALATYGTLGPWKTLGPGPEGMQNVDDGLVLQKSIQVEIWSEICVFRFCHYPTCRIIIMIAFLFLSDFVSRFTNWTNWNTGVCISSFVVYQYIKWWLIIYTNVIISVSSSVKSSSVDTRWCPSSYVCWL